MYVSHDTPSRLRGRTVHCRPPKSSSSVSTVVEYPWLGLGVWTVGVGNHRYPFSEGRDSDEGEDIPPLLLSYM